MCDFLFWRSVILFCVDNAVYNPEKVITNPFLILCDNIFLFHCTCAKVLINSKFMPSHKNNGTVQTINFVPIKAEILLTFLHETCVTLTT